MKNRNKKQMKKLISSLCAVSSMGLVQPSTSTSAFGNVHMCSKELAENAADEFENYIKKGVIPYLSDKKDIKIDIDRKWSYDEKDMEESAELTKNIKNKMNELLSSMSWKVFVDETIAKYKLSINGLNEEKEKSLKALGDALKEIGKSGEFEPIGPFGFIPNKGASFSDLIVQIGTTGESHYQIDQWNREIKKKLRFKIPMIGKVAIVGGGIAGACILGSAVISKMKSWNDDRRARRAIEHKEKFQKQEDTQAQLFADKVDIDPKKINIEKLKTMLETEAQDWPYAATEIKQFIDTYIGILISKQKNPLAKCPPIILVGKPGCGKTEWIKRVINCTFNCIEDKNKNENKVKGKSKDKTNSKSEINWQDRCILINQDKIDKNSSVSPREQISGTHEEKREDVSITCYSDSAKANKFGKGIHLKYIDEIEKLLVDVILSIWDTADSGGRAIVLATGNGNPADYIKGDGADFKEAFEDRAIILEIPQPDKSYIRKSIKKLINDINNINPDKSPVVVSEESLNGLVDACRSMRSVETMRSPILGLQISQTLKQRKNVPIKINPKNPKPERIILDESYQEKNTN